MNNRKNFVTTPSYKVNKVYSCSGDRLRKNINHRLSLWGIYSMR